MSLKSNFAFLIKVAILYIVLYPLTSINAMKIHYYSYFDFIYKIFKIRFNHSKENKFVVKKERYWLCGNKAKSLPLLSCMKYDLQAHIKNVTQSSSDFLPYYSDQVNPRRVQWSYRLFI